MLAIANPANGQGFFSILFHYDWEKAEDRVGITKDKLHALVTARVPTERYLKVLLCTTSFVTNTYLLRKLP